MTILPADFVELDLDILIETEKALLVSDGTDEVWLPKSQIHYDGDAQEGGHATIGVPEWLAKNNCLI